MRRIQKAFAAQNRLWFLTRFLLSKEKIRTSRTSKKARNSTCSTYFKKKSCGTVETARCPGFSPVRIEAEPPSRNPRKINENERGHFTQQVGRVGARAPRAYPTLARTNSGRAHRPLCARTFRVRFWQRPITTTTFKRSNYAQIFSFVDRRRRFNFRGR